MGRNRKVATLASFLLVLISLWPDINIGIDPTRAVAGAADSNSTCNPHVIFTTFVCPGPACSHMRQTIEANTRHVWSSMTDVEFRVMNLTKTNSYGMPELGDMYLHAMRACPEAQTYTYLNGDIIGTRGFMDTIVAVTKTRLKEFLIVGRRTNVPWNETYDATREDFNFSAHFNSGELFTPLAEDYFCVTRNAMDWAEIPPFVIGRPGYDNWLVEQVRKKPNVTLIDATLTAQMIHQTGDGGDFAWGGVGAHDEKADINYNLRLVSQFSRNGKFPHTGGGGKTWNARWQTDLYDSPGVQGRILLRNHFTREEIK